jgi:YfiH family protein
MTAPAATTCEVRQQGDLEVLTWPRLDGLDAQVMVTTRQGGVSPGPYASLNLSLSVGDEPGAVLENRRRVAAALGVGLDDFVFARQVHGARAQVVSARDRGRGARSLGDAVPDTDALVTQDLGTVLAILVGDCVPVILLDPAARVLACVHAGWRGTVGRVTAAALAAMATLGARPQDVLAGIGPAIAPDRYQVGEEVAEQVSQAFDGDTASLLRPDGSGRWLLDLWEANRRSLIEAGVPDHQVQLAAVPTGPGASPADPGIRPASPDAGPAGPAGLGTGEAAPDTAPAGSAAPDGAPDGLFFSDRTARPCGRFALVARLTRSGPQHSGPQHSRLRQRESA